MRICGEVNPLRPGIVCDLEPDHRGPHMHFDSNGTTAWGLWR